MTTLEHFNSTLFLGFAVDSSFKKSLDSLSCNKKSLFIQKNDAYLQECYFDGCLFLGKYLKKSSNLPQIQLSTLNIYSLLEKIVPNYSYDQSDLWLIPVIDGES